MKIEGVDLDLATLPGADGADVAVRHHRLDLQTAVGRQHHERRARRRGVEITAMDAPKSRSRTAGSGDVVALARAKDGIDDGSGDE